MINSMNSMPRKVWRVEIASSGVGPYTAGGIGLYATATVLCDKHRDCPEHPSPPLKVFRQGDDLVCGFLTLEDLFRWFDDEDLELMENSKCEEYVVCRYEVPGTEYIDDTGQCVFSKTHARKLQVMPISQVRENRKKRLK